MLEWIALSSALSYSASSLWLAWQWQNNVNARWALCLGWFSLGLHTLYLGLVCQQQSGFSFDLVSMASLNLWAVVLVLLLCALKKPVAKLGIFLFPLAGAVLVLDVTFNPLPRMLTIESGAMGLHILTSMLASSLLMVAAVQAVLLTIQYGQLKQHPPSRLSLFLPSLQTMEALLFQLLQLGVALLTVSLGSGFVFLHDLFAQHLAHKTVLSLLAWVIFCALLIGRQYYGWRGRVAVNWILAGFLLLALGYFGSKLVLELILVRV